MPRCQTCFNLVAYCTCPIERDPTRCYYHNPLPRDRPKMWACTCSGSPLFECEVCERLNVPEKRRGIGYVCDDCMEHYFDDAV